MPRARYLSVQVSYLDGTVHVTPVASLLSIWLGPSPPNASLKEGLLGG